MNHYFHKRVSELITDALISGWLINSSMLEVSTEEKHARRKGPTFMCRSHSRIRLADSDENITIALSKQLVKGCYQVLE